MKFLFDEQMRRESFEPTEQSQEVKIPGDSTLQKIHGDGDMSKNYPFFFSLLPKKKEERKSHKF